MTGRINLRGAIARIARAPGYRWFLGLAMLGLVLVNAGPIGIEVLGGKPAPESIKIVSLPDGSHLCQISSTCEAVTPAAAGFDLMPANVMVVMTVVIVAVAIVARPRPAAFGLLLLNPPPRLHTA